MTAAKCTATTASGNRCRRAATHDDQCRQHAISSGVVAGPVRQAPRQPAVTCECAEPRLTVTTDVGVFDAEPCGELTPSSALYTAACSHCGGTYRKTWRRVRGRA